jgi:hypothetical protein
MLTPRREHGCWLKNFMPVTDHVVLPSITGSGMGAAAVFERGDSVDELSNARHIQSHNFLSKDVKK